LPENKNEQDSQGIEFYQRFLSGNNDAFAELVALFEDEFYRFINGIVRDHHETKHIIHDAFVHLASDGKRFKGKSSIKTYLFAIGKNIALQHVKRRGREQNLTHEIITKILSDGSETPDSILERKENGRKIHQAIQELRENYRVVLTLLYFEDRSYIEVGQIINKDVNQVRVLAHRAKAALKKKLENSGVTHV